MHDPKTVAHEIRLPWPGRRYGLPILTIWHVDPEDHTVRQGRRDDDSCGWFTPPTTPEERARIRKMGAYEWSVIFGQRAAMAEGKSYAHVAFKPTTYDAIFWAWWEIKRASSKGWYKPRRRGVLTRAEEREVYQLAANPVDNLQVTVAHVKDAETCADFFMLVYAAYLRHHRPWWRHPRWHVHHWQFQVHAVQWFKRRFVDRCCRCGGHFAANESPIGSWGGDELWHSRCDTASYRQPEPAHDR